MAVADVTPYVSANANGVTTSFPFPFQVFQDTDLVVIVAGAVKTLGTDYTVTLADPGGTVDFPVAPTAGLVEMAREQSADRTTDYQTAGPFFADTVDDDLDRVVMLIQELKRTVGILSSAGLAARLAALEGLVPFGPGSVSVQIVDATAGQVVVGIVAANDPGARPMVIGKTDASANMVTVRPAAGTISTAEGRSATCDLTMQDQAIWIVPDAANNNWMRG
ncbi:MAG TPA: hypothetical protein VI298_08745 [Geobacteraceae bacterium]